MRSLLQNKKTRKTTRVLNNLLFIFSLFFFLLPITANGATLFIDPQNKEVKVGDTFSVSVNVNSQGVAINAGTLDIKFDPTLLSVQSVGKTTSIFSLWAEEPTYSNVNGLIHFSGGLSSPGWNGNNGGIIRITFKAKSIGQTKITPSNGSVLANDGVGTDVLRGVTGSNIKIIKSITVPTQVVEKEATSTDEVLEVSSLKIPIIVNLPDVLSEGDTLEFNGQGIANGQIQVYIQKGQGDIEITQISTKEDGKFNITYRTPVVSGFYKIWARNISKDGVLSTSSDTSFVEVINKAAFNIYGKEILYLNLIMLLSVICLFLLITSILIFLKFRKVQTLLNKRIKKKVKELEE